MMVDCLTVAAQVQIERRAAFVAETRSGGVRVTAEGA